MTAIEWTHRPGTVGRVWNPVTGCRKVSEGCRRCYAETVANRFWGTQYPDWPERPRRFTDVLCHADRLAAPLAWRKPATVFVNSMGDLFHEDVLYEFIDQVFSVMALCPQHTFVVLTKRPKRMQTYCSTLAARDVDVSLAIVRTPYWGSSQASLCAVATIEDRIGAGPLPNVWLGVSVEDQASAVARIPPLLQAPAAVRVVSAEPLLGPIDLSDGPSDPETSTGGPFNWLELGIDWLIVGGESGPQARPCDVAWVRALKDQAQSAGVPCFVKQLGAHVTDRNDAGFEGDTLGSWPMDTHREDVDRGVYQGAAVRIRLKNRKGGDPAEWPHDLRVREWPSDARRVG